MGVDTSCMKALRCVKEFVGFSFGFLAEIGPFAQTDVLTGGRRYFRAQPTGDNGESSLFYRRFFWCSLPPRRSWFHRPFARACGFVVSHVFALTAGMSILVEGFAFTPRPLPPVVRWGRARRVSRLPVSGRSVVLTRSPIRLLLAEDPVAGLGKMAGPLNIIYFMLPSRPTAYRHMCSSFSC